MNIEGLVAARRAFIAMEHRAEVLSLIRVPHMAGKNDLRKRAAMVLDNTASYAHIAAEKLSDAGMRSESVSALIDAAKMLRATPPVQYAARESGVTLSTILRHVGAAEPSLMAPEITAIVNRPISAPSMYEAIRDATAAAK